MKEKHKKSDFRKNRANLKNGTTFFMISASVNTNSKVRAQLTNTYGKASPFVLLTLNIRSTYKMYYSFFVSISYLEFFDHFQTCLFFHDKHVFAITHMFTTNMNIYNHVKYEFIIQHYQNVSSVLVLWCNGQHSGL